MLFVTRKHSSRMRTARFCSSGGYTLPPTWIPYLLPPDTLPHDTLPPDIPCLDTLPLDTLTQVQIQGAQGPRPSLDPRFWGPKTEHLWALFNFSIFFCLPHFAQHIISSICCFFKVQIQKFSSLASLAYYFSPRSLFFCLSFTHFRLLGVHLSLSCF